MASFVCSSEAWASSSGQVRYSGLQGAICSSCHTNGDVPTVTLAGPLEVEANETAAYTVTLSVAGLQGGFNVAVDGDGALSDDGIGNSVRLLLGELTHSDAEDFDGQPVSWSFNWTAPAASGSHTMYAAGVGGDNAGASAGDGVGTTTLALTVVCPADADGDTICDADDNCPNVANTDQLDADDSKVGDACEGAVDDNGSTEGNTEGNTEDGTFDNTNNGTLSSPQLGGGGCASVVLIPWLIPVAFLGRLRRRS